MFFSGTSLVPLVVQAKHIELFQVSNSTHLSVITDVFYSKNVDTQAQCLILIISDGTYLIPVLVTPESIEEQFRLTTLNSTALNNLRHKVITIRKSAVSVYRRGNRVSPYIIALDWQKETSENVIIRPGAQHISHNPKVRRWIKMFDTFELPKDKSISSFFKTPFIDQLFPFFAQVEYILEKLLAASNIESGINDSENTAISPLKRTVSNTFDVTEKKVKTKTVHVESISMTDLSKEELKEEFNNNLNRLHSMANDTHMSAFGRINALSKLRSLCYIKYCDS
ncbi:hypothetical protein BDF21DRAFT_424989 [Thamnidium elegans]|nr:hypothetical protein BDF21DRAFT_424989 [Thamnidium elegans]